MRVAINGAGVAGPALAYWLRRLGGHEPVLFEKAPALRHGGYMIDFWGLGYELAMRMGILPAVRQHAYLMERLRMVDGEGHDIACIDVRPVRELLGGRFVSLARSDLAALLFDACDGVPARFGVSVAGIVPVDGAVMVELTDGSREQFDLVVGADGLHSRVRELVFGPEIGFERSLDCYVAAFRLRSYPHRENLTYVSCTVPKRQVARVSLRDDETLVLLVCRAELIDGVPSHDQQKEALRRAFGNMKWEVPEILDRMGDVNDLYFDRVSQIHLPRWTSGRVALLGDAAACPSLLAGEGTGLAMIEAYVLAGELHRAGGDVARAFAAFEGKVRSFVTAKQKAALQFRSFFAPQSWFALWQRDLAIRALALPLLGKHLLARSVRDSFELPDYLPA